MITAILSFLTTSVNIKNVEQKYFESGHSHMECDAMHSAIETNFRHKEVELPSDYIQCMKQARRLNSSGGPYRVTELTSDEFIDYAEMNNIAFNANAFKGIIQCHHIIYSKGQQNDEDAKVSMAKEIDGERRLVSFRKRGGRHNLSNTGKCYGEPPGIKPDKKKDLLSMINNMTNRTLANMYYSSLTTVDD